MLDEIINLAIANGLWAVLFVFMLFYQIRSSAIRERNYQQTINKLAITFGVIKNVDSNVKDIAKNIGELKIFFAKGKVIV